jgi:hypothetical protein
MIEVGALYVSFFDWDQFKIYPYEPCPLFLENKTNMHLVYRLKHLTGLIQLT